MAASPMTMAPTRARVAPIARSAPISCARSTTFEPSPVATPSRATKTAMNSSA